MSWEVSAEMAINPAQDDGISALKPNCMADAIGAEPDAVESC